MRPLPPNNLRILYNSHFFLPPLNIFLVNQLKKGFQFTFNWFQITFNWFQFIFNWFQFTFNLLLINLLSIYFQLISIVWMLFFNKGLIRHLIIWKTLHFKALTQIWLSKVKASALPKERWRKGFVFFSLLKVCAHNRVPSRQLYYWVTEPLIG